MQCNQLSLMIGEGGVAESAGSSLLQCARQQYHRRNINPPGGPNLAGLANLPGLSALTGLSLPHGANLASLLASGKLLYQLLPVPIASYLLPTLPKLPV